jgi:hypothetical protein
MSLEATEPVFVNVNVVQESIPTPTAYVAWLAGTTNRVVPARQAGNRFLGSLKGLQIRAPSPYL